MGDPPPPPPPELRTGPPQVGDGSRSGKVEWRVETRPHSYAYEDSDEQIGSAFKSIRDELGFEDTASFSAWIYETTCSEGESPDGRSYTYGGVDVPPVLLDAVEFPALGWEQMHYVIDCVAQALGVSPGTLLDELHLRASGRYRADGSEIPEEQ